MNVKLNLYNSEVTYESDASDSEVKHIIKGKLAAAQACGTSKSPVETRSPHHNLFIIKKGSEATKK
jgi:hypothetical protein